MADERKQINIRVDDELLKTIEELRAMHRPIPTVSDLIREAVTEKYERERKRK